MKITAGYIARIVDEVNRNHLIAGDGVRLSRGPGGTKLDAFGVEGVRARASSGLHPWKVRYHKPTAEEGGSEPDGQWEVYLPPGTLTIRSNCYVINDPASYTGGHDEETESGIKEEQHWYTIPLSEGSGNGETEFRIVAHGKPSVMMNSGGGSYTQASPFVAVTAEPIDAEGGQQQHRPLEDEHLVTHYAGDVWSAVIATVKVKRETANGKTTVTRSVSQVLKAAVNVNADTPTFFRPVWQMSWNGSSALEPLTVDHLYLDDRTIYVGGASATAPNADLKEFGTCRIYLTIDTSGSSPAAELSVEEVGQGYTPPASTATLQPIQIFEMNELRITSDLRRNLQNLPYYRGIA